MLSRILILPLMLVLLGGVAVADEHEKTQAPALQELAEMVAQRAAAHVKQYDETRQRIRLELIEALGRKDVAAVKGLKQKLEVIERRKKVARRVFQSVTEATALLRDADDTEKLNEAQAILAKAVQSLEVHGAKARPAPQFVTQRARLPVVAVGRKETEARLRKARKSAEALRRRQVDAQEALERARAAMAGIQQPPPTKGTRAVRTPAGGDRLHQGRVKLHHMHQAAKHLRQAGMPEAAERVKHEAELLEVRLREATRNQELHQVLAELRRDVRALRAEVEELRSKLR